MRTAADIEAARLAIAGVPGSAARAPGRGRPHSRSTGAGVIVALVRVWLVVLAVVAVAEVLSEVVLALLVVIVSLALVRLVVLAVRLLVAVAVDDIEVLVADEVSEVALVLVSLALDRLVVLAVLLLVPVADEVVMVAEVLSEVMLVLVVAVRVTLVLVQVVLVTVWVLVPVEIVGVLEIVVLKPAHAQGHSSNDPSTLQSARGQKKRSAQVVVVDVDAVEDVLVSEAVEDAEVGVDEHSHGHKSIDTLHKAR